MIYKHKTDAMQAIVKQVSRGYLFWTSGTVSVSKYETLRLKMSDRYGIERTAQQRWRGKQKGLANACLIAFPTPSGLEWFLLASEGEGLVHDLETLKNAQKAKERLSVTGYELVKKPNKNDKARWTYQMTKETLEFWRCRFRTAIQHRNDSDLRQAMYSLRRVPVFRGVRLEAFGIEKAAIGDWQRFRSGEWPFPAIALGFKGKFRQAEKMELA